ncbi:MAG: hypothetical protein Q8O67_29475 [Deltaproteobacteria bacterium]|nr:hypothetical protein [Deltaproteobacteria bacterium]
MHQLLARPLKALNDAALAVVVVVTTLGAGCGELLTPDKVRDHLENPRAAVDDDTMGRTARDFFSAQRASSAQSLAFFARDDGGETSNLAGAWAAGDETWRRSMNFAAGDDVGDVLCAANLAAAIIIFDGCEAGDNCEANLEVDSCVLRIGDGADENAKGKIVFKLKNTTNADFQRTELRLTFEDFEVTGSDDDTADYFDGLLAIETTEFLDRDDGAADRVEVILAADITQQTRRLERFPIFDDGKISSTRATAGVRFIASDGETEDSVGVELLAFVDEDDNARDQSVVLRFGANSKEVSPDLTLADATLEVEGTNGSFSCKWSAAEETLGEDGEQGTVKSEGDCVDEDGDTFSFEAESTCR